MQININVISIIIGTGIILGLFISILVLTVKKKNKLPNIFLALFLLAISFTPFCAILYETRAYKYLPHLVRLDEPFRFLIAPFFYFYTVALINGRLKRKKQLPLHFILFIANLILLTPFYIQSPDFKIRFVIDNFLTNRVPFIAYNFTLFIVLLFQLIFYVFLVKKEIKEYEAKVKDIFSSIDAISLSWLYSFANILQIFCIFLFLFLFLGFIFSIIIRWPINKEFLLISRPFTGFVPILLIVFVFKALRQPLILSDIFENSENVSPGEKYEASSLLPEDAEKYLRKLDQYMEKGKAYLKPELTLQEIADGLQIPARHLSQVINEKIGMNFYNYINSYRIEEIKKFLSDPTYKNETILNLAYDVGFNSKATFNAVFKKSTGLTPKEFRRIAFS